MGTVRVGAAAPPGGLIQWFAGAVAFLVQVALALHHADEVGERLLLVDRDVPEVAAHRLHTREQKWLFVCDKLETCPESRLPSPYDSLTLVTLSSGRSDY